MAPSPIPSPSDVLLVGIGSKAETTEQLLLELGRLCAIPRGYRMTTHAFLPVLSFMRHPDVTAGLRLSNATSGQLARWLLTSLSRSVVDRNIEGYSPYQRWFPALSINTKLCPGRPACMPLPMVP